MFASVIAIYYTNIATDYSASFDEGTKGNITAFNNIEELQEDTTNIENQLFNTTQSSSGVTDLLGKFLGAGFNTLKLAKNSFTTFYDIADNAFSNSYLGDSLSPFKGALILVVVILVTFIILSVLIGREV